jgi:hypothetical protein
MKAKYTPKKQRYIRYNISFAIGNRYGKVNAYSLKEFCLCVLDRYSITECELADIVTLHKEETYIIPGVLKIQRKI